MTAICGGGASQGRPGFNATVALTVPAIGALLNNVPTPWAVAFAALIGLANYELSTFCTVDPPTLPVLVAQDFIDMLTYVDFFAHLQAQQKLQQFVAYYAWFQFCECSSVATPAPTAAQPQPTGMPAINPPAGPAPYPTGTPCTTLVFSDTQMAGGVPTAFTPIDTITYAVITMNTTITATAVGRDFRFSVQFVTSGGSFLTSPYWYVNSAGVATTSPMAVPATTAFYRIFWTSTGGDTNPGAWQAQVDLYCGTTPGGSGGLVPGACPTDPNTTLMLQSILDLLTIVQRRAVPFAYIPGASHSGLTGNGTLTIPSCIGVLVTLTSVPGWVGIEGGSPDEIFEAGWFSWGNASGYIAREFISHNPQLSFPAEAAQYTRVGYSLSPGVVATIQELYAEP